MKKVVFLSFLFILFNHVFNEEAFSWSEGTHMNLSEYAAENSVLDKNKGDYLKNLGFEKGLDESFKWGANKLLKEWIAEGANLEDAADIPLDLLENKGRFNNHFHVPTRGWTDPLPNDLFDAGLDDDVHIPLTYLSTFPVMTPILLLDPWLSQFPDYNNEILHIYGISSLLWAQDGSYQFNLDEDEGDWSWQKIRELYYSALISTTDALRQENFAKVFRGLGHQIHLVQDAAQPDHVRNDGHPWDSLGLVNLFRKKGGGFEKWLKDNNQFLKCLLEDHTLPNCTGFRINATVNIDDYMPQVPLDPSQLVLDPEYSNRGLAPSALFIDTDQYNGSNPSTSFSQGISEYTNANFFSDDTIFPTERFSTNHRHYFPYPRKGSTNIQSYFDGVDLTKTVTARDGILDTRIWISKVGDGENIEFFVTMDYLSRAYYTVLGEGPTYYKSLYRDEEAHKDYAQKLIPRAVGYSAGLLDYFFRGEIEITLPDTGAYAQTSDQALGFTQVTLLAKNTTSTGEEMTDGSIELVVKYKLAQEDPFQSFPVPTDAEFTYTKVPEKDGTRSIPRNNTIELTFGTGQSTIIPLWATNVYLQVVYKGRLGNEDGAVAVGFKDISEPTPVDIFNNMDKICLYGNWYDAGSPEAIAQMDPSQWDIYIHNIENAYIKISNITNPISASPSDYTFYSPAINAGTLYRVYVLSDYESGFNFSDYMTVVKKTPEDPWIHGIIGGDITASSIKNQTDYNVESQTECDTVGATAPCEIRYYPLFYPFRGINIWGPAGYIIDNAKYPIDTTCSWELLQ